MKHQQDGLYLVNYQGICSGYVVRNGKVTVCAPVLRERLDFFSKIARYIPTDVSIPPPEVIRQPPDED